MTSISDLFFDEITGDVIDRETGEVLDQIYQYSDSVKTLNSRILPPRNMGNLIQQIEVKHLDYKINLRRLKLIRCLQRKYSDEDLPDSIFYSFYETIKFTQVNSNYLCLLFEKFCLARKIIINKSRIRQKHWKITETHLRSNDDLKKLCYFVAKAMGVSGANVFMIATILQQHYQVINKSLAAIACRFYMLKTKTDKKGDQGRIAKCLCVSSSVITRGVNECVRIASINNLQNK